MRQVLARRFAHVTAFAEGDVFYVVGVLLEKSEDEFRECHGLLLLGLCVGLTGRTCNTYAKRVKAQSRGLTLPRLTIGVKYSDTICHYLTIADQPVRAQPDRAQPDRGKRAFSGDVVRRLSMYP